MAVINRRAKKPGFSRTYARKHGDKAAVVVRFLAHHVNRAIEADRNSRDGKHWYFNSLSELASKLPYIPRSTLSDILEKLAKDNQIEVGTFNKLGFDKTTWYTVPQAVRDAAEEDVIYFDAAVATQLKRICEAVLYQNIRHFEQKKKCSSVKLSPTTLSRILPYSSQQIARALRNLVKAELIARDERAASHYRSVSTAAKPPATDDDESKSFLL